MSYTLNVSNDDDGRRLDRFLRTTFKTVTLGEIMKSIRKGEVRINGARVRDGSTHISSGDELTVKWEKGEVVIPKSAGLGKIKVIHHGRNVMIVNKPSGILVQPDEPNGDSVITRIWSFLGTRTPAAVHRLDRNTTGVLAVALHGDALRALEALFKARRVRKIYMAVLVGKIQDEITVDASLLKDAENNTVKVSPDGMRAVSKITCLSSDGEYSLARIELLTGRTHQARVHAAHIGHPILGDRKYGDFNANRAMKSITRPLLHAYELGFPEDIDESLEEISGRNFVAELPDDMKDFTEKRFNIKK
ncbi:MAG: RluA family pseudouridine synthase [Synergistaceae bacterium]|nr:RluA family pseudouridine synthase [Synergistaceae bacterium]MBQ3760068.1 RluA family pseudouridine synthase [Synergistaceae bacterium]MBQ4401904.1 RluA family pseudouridine synthase [Synergistaceae bacterium]MBQ6113763.1 RluA family pseudouridine synthase [Synergistaceae bacterium]MBQ6982101.1 RluA family pseudouridine synthase [Synergistaceae bacterium]